MAILFKVPSWNTLQISAQLTCSCYRYLSCFLYNHIFWRSNPLQKKSETLSIYRQPDRHLLHAVHFDRRGCSWPCTIDPHDSCTVTCPLPYPSSPASWTLLSSLSVPDSRNISSNNRHHYTSFQLCHWCLFKIPITRSCPCLKASSFQL